MSYFIVFFAADTAPRASAVLHRFSLIFFERSLQLAKFAAKFF
jgi:hypothetical protein